ncbi:MAG: outer membrane protein assembly factor BamE [Verrucomicrobiota bacterium]|nr:outer membrane protein assembly factor BamE [Verrucomicrobiota bacterium]
MAVPRLRHLGCALACSVMLASCDTSTHLTKANVDEVAAGMARKQVESILGIPTSVETVPYEAKEKTIYLYRQGTETVTIVFWEEKVESKVTTLTK